MIIPSDEICYKEICGKLGNKTLYKVGVIGGLHLVELRSPDGSKQVIGAGSHPGVARMTAKRLHPDIEWTELAKSQEIDERDVSDILPFWLEVVASAQKKLG
jgi:hypothetical protein